MKDKSTGSFIYSLILRRDQPKSEEIQENQVIIFLNESNDLVYTVRRGYFEYCSLDKLEYEDLKNRILSLEKTEQEEYLADPALVSSVLMDISETHFAHLLSKGWIQFAKKDAATAKAVFCNQKIIKKIIKSEPEDIYEIAKKSFNLPSNRANDDWESYWNTRAA